MPEQAPTRTDRGLWMTAALLGFVAGTALQLQQAALWPVWLYAFWLVDGLALAALGFAVVDGRRWRQLLLGVGLGLLGFALTGLRAAVFMASALTPALEGQDLRVTGQVAAMPQRHETGVRFRFDVESTSLSDKPVLLPQRLALSWYGGVFSAESGGAAERSPPALVAGLQRQPPDLRAGERWQFTVRLKAPHGNRNPHGFDYELWLWEQGVQATGYVRTGPKDSAPQRLGQTAWHPVEQARQAARDAIFSQVAERQLAGIIAALVTGDQNAIDRADWDVFRATGVAHLMSISGLHITMFAWLAGALVLVLWRRSVRLCLWLPAPNAALLGGLLLAAGYALFSGWGVPAQRTVWMLTTATLLRLSGRQWPPLSVWLLVMAVVVAIDPWALLQAGFWLSFVAVAVLFATDSRAVESVPKRAGGHFLSLIREQSVVTLALTPLTLLLFGQVSVVGIGANLLAIPWVTLVVTPLSLLGLVWAPVWQAAAWATQWLAWLLQAVAQLPFSTVAMAAAPLWAGIAGVLGGVLLALRLPVPVRLLGLPLMLPVLLWQAPRPPAGEFELLAADVGQGNAVLVRTARHTLVYDTGPRYSSDSDAGHRVLVPLLRALGERVDTLLLSHRDADHTGGAVAVLAMQPQAGLLSSIEPGHPLQMLRPNTTTRCTAGQRWHWDGVSFELLHPQPADYTPLARSNALSCVLRISNGQRHALLAGDIEAAQEERLVQGGAPLLADWLLVPHHGSKTSSSAAFLAAVQPRMAVVQAGYRNRFGHPAAPVLARYEAAGVRVYDSPRCGALTWRSAEPDGVLCERNKARRYWQRWWPPERAESEP